MPTESKPLSREERDTFKRMLSPHSAGDYALESGFSETFDAFYRALADIDRLEAEVGRLREALRFIGYSTCEASCFDLLADPTTGDRIESPHGPERCCIAEHRDARAALGEKDA